MKEKFLKNIHELKKHFIRLNFAFDKLKENYKLPLKKEDVERIIDNNEDTMIIDQIVYRFSKIQDTIGKTLRMYLNLKGENTFNMSMIDIINLSEKIGVDISKEKWFELRELRNILTHEYEDEYEEIARVLNKIYEEKDYLKNLAESLKLEE